jgi:hypothetical protein
MSLFGSQNPEVQDVRDFISIGKRNENRISNFGGID